MGRLLGQVDKLNIEDQNRVGRNYGPESALSWIMDVNAKDKIEGRITNHKPCAKGW